MINSVLRGLPVFACAAVLLAQPSASPQSPSPKSAGLEASWEIAPVLQEIATHAGRLLPQLDNVNAQAWVEKGASDTYLAQLQSCKDQARALAADAKALSANPERLSAALEVLFRIQGLDTMLASLEEGLRRYQGATAAQQLAGLAAEGGASRNRLQQYVVSLAAEREQELQVMDKEAQRCRGLVTQAPPKSGRKK
jgi:hypothetical protein